MTPGMRETVTRNLLKHAASVAMFCPMCSTILDYRRVVLVDPKTRDDGRKMTILCGTCWNGLPDSTRSEVLSSCDVTIGEGVTS